MVRSLLTILAVGLFLASPNMAEASEPFSPWVEISGSRTRLFAASPWEDGALAAGIQLELQEGWKTYWLNPGPSGIPPRLDFSNSENLAEAKVFWPVPVRFEDGDSESVGYLRRIIVPLHVVPEDRSKPVFIKARFEFGLCEKICVPAQAELEYALAPGVIPDVMTDVLLNGFKSRVPRPGKIGDETPLAVTAVERSAEGLLVKVRYPESGGVRDLFAKAEDQAISLPQKKDDGSFTIALKPGAGPKTIDLVAVDSHGGILVPVSLDDLPAKP